MRTCLCCMVTTKQSKDKSEATKKRMTFKLTPLVRFAGAWIILGWCYFFYEYRGELPATMGDRDVESTGPTIRLKYDAEARKHRDMPTWTDKFPFFPREDAVKNRICFVHIGKTAGSTLACTLGFQYPACTWGSNKLVHLPGNLPAFTTNLIHTKYDTCERTDIDIWLFTLRDPLSRMQSWFTYERPHSKNSPYYAEKYPLFVECNFQTINEVGEALVLGDSTRCAKRAYRAISGMKGMAVHNFYNYQYYYDRVPANGRIAVIRTEHLQDDWNSIETQLLDGIPVEEDSAVFKAKNKSSKSADDKYLSQTAQENLCRVLCQEIQLYKRILHAAENLNEHDVEVSLTELDVKCPLEARSDECEEPWPRRES